MTYTVDTPRSRRRFRWPRLPLGEGQAAWTTRALMLLAPLLSFTLVEYLNYNNPWTDFTSLQIALNLAWYYLGELFFYFVLRRRASAVKWAMGIAWGLGMANHYLISFRGRTLFPGDFLTVSPHAVSISACASSCPCSACSLWLPFSETDRWRIFLSAL